ncbi:4-hydroxythreonine-4-phosphate dehydrogenase PdxA [Salsuginibacillus kocurii]|uniref:4-hydroxythreonine-4-phosphate dehydrogenase PdxA n=1 Tax=Salsuginibacillus kocurii TaxID=427078 RepID=UPI00037EA1B0|nr:4-hydroxythreonine-4-phosphate dehydrogenase PdxA [Salsuginibacillus kocurii]
MTKPVIGITMGDAAGVGPEIIAKALADEALYDTCNPVVIGDVERLNEVVEIIKTDQQVKAIEYPRDIQADPSTIHCLQVGSLESGLPFGELSYEAGKHAFLYLEKAVHLAMDKEIDAICTAPLNKEALQGAGYNYPGHTEILADLTGTSDYSMMLSAPNLKVIHLTTHVGLKDAIEAITPERTYNVIRLAYDTLSKAGFTNPKIAVCGINPHAGENGLFGYGEEEAQLIPGINKAQDEGIQAEGPYPADTLFFRAARGDFDTVVACYHDQGHAPVKVLGLEAGVNITVGLKHGVIRTSVDHGTAFDIAGKNIADERSLKEAISAAIELSPK